MRGTRDSVTVIRTTTIRTIQYPSDVPGAGSSSPNLFKPRDFTLEDLFDAYFDCRKNKRNSLNQLAFEADLETNILELWHDLKDGSYEIGPSLAFVIRYPKMREIWAANFRDRVVHHLLYNAISDHYYRRFIRDSYACIPDRGVHDGMRRVSGFARSVTRNWTKPAHALKVDVASFFNSIDKLVLLDIIDKSMAPCWCRDLLHQVIKHDPRRNAVLRSSNALFKQVRPEKSLLNAPDNKGLPIGNLTSQFFANVYMNELDQFVKHRVKAKYYGRYVDDMVLFHEDVAVLNHWKYQIDSFLQQRLSLHLHPNKTWINRADAGIDFVGFIIKPGRTYIRKSSLNRCKQKVRAWEIRGSKIDQKSLQKLSDSMTSYLGMLRQVNGYNARKEICGRVENLFIHADEDYTKILPAS